MDTDLVKIESAESSKKSARAFSYGNIIASLFPPLFVLWFGASIIVYAILRHHPNPRVGFYTQRAAYYYYAIAGSLVPVLTFAPSGFLKNYWLYLWAICGVVLITLSIRLIRQINRESWEDIEYKGKP
jgi:hypothetical protein